MSLYKSIKRVHVLAHAITLITVFIVSFLSSAVYAHFGTKGPFGGTVSCITSRDSLVYLGTANGGVFESTTNSLIAWRARPVGLTSGKITALTHSGSYLFAATADSGIFIFNGFVGADRYWNKINNGLTSLKIKSLLALDSITIIAGTDGNGLFKTSDKGGSWTAINSPSLNNAVITGIVKAGSRIMLLAQNGGVFVSDNNGDTWSDFNDTHTLGIAGTGFLSYNPATDELFVVNNNGLYIAVNAATTTNPVYVLSQTNFPSNTAIRGVANNGTQWYLATDKGIFTSTAVTISWTTANTGLNGNDVTAVAAVQNRLLAGIAKEGIFRATSGINSWSPLNTNFNNPETHSMTAAGDSLVIAVTANGVFISKDLATSYVKSNNGLTDSLNINDIIVADFCLLAATRNGGVFLSTDTGKTWTTANAGLSNLHVKKLFYANAQKYAIDADGKLFVSELTSTTWTPIQNGLPSGVMPTSMAFYGGRLILGTWGAGVYVKEQSGTSWTSANSGLNNLDVTSVAASANKIFAGTHGNGVFVSDISAISWSATATTSIAHTAMIGLNGADIQAMASYGGYVYASYKGGLLTTSNNGATWIAGGNQFNLPSFTDVTRICFVSSRVFVSTENNAVYSNALSELPVLADTLVISRTSATVNSADTALPVSVTSNRGWTVTSDQPWLTVSKADGFRDGDFNILLAANNGVSRNGTITVTAGTQIETISVTQDGTSAVSHLHQLAGIIRVYPNPNKGAFVADFTSLHTAVESLVITDISGRILKQVPIEQEQTSVPVVMNYPAGVYFLALKTANGMVTQLLVIQ